MREPWHRLEIRPQPRADRPWLSLQRAWRVPRPSRRRRGRAPAAGQDAGALQGARPGQGAGKQRTDSTHVLAAVRDLSFLERVAETLRAALDDVAAVAPDCLREVANALWFEPCPRRDQQYRLPTRPEYAECVPLDQG